MSSPEPVAGDEAPTDTIVLTFQVDQNNPTSYPLLKLPAEHQDSTERCSCEKARQRFNPHIDEPASEGVFLLKIVCRSEAVVDQAKDMYRECLRISPPQTRSPERIRNLLYSLAGLCECRTPAPSSEQERSSKANAHALVPYSEEVKFQDVNKMRKKVNARIAKRLKLRLKSDDRGYIYLISSEDVPGHVKIAYSKDDPHRRLSELSHCYRKAKLVAYTTTSVPNSIHIKSLIHAELMSYRRKEQCLSCGSLHGDWFEISEVVASQTVNRWVTWMASDPYERTSGMLKDCWLRKLNVASKLTPAVDHFKFKGLTWQTWTDGRRPTGSRDCTGKVHVTIVERRKIPLRSA